MCLLAASLMQLIHSKPTFLPHMPTSDYIFKTSIHNLKKKNIRELFFFYLQADVEGAGKTAQRKYTADEMKRRGITQFFK